MDDSYIKKLETLTPLLDQFVERRNGSVIEYGTDDGTCIGIGLFKNNNIAIQRAFMSAGTQFKRHSHKQWEMLIVYEGCLRFEAGDEVRDIRACEFIDLPPNTPHSCLAVEDTWMVGVTIPAEPDYPVPGDARQGEFKDARER